MKGVLRVGLLALAAVMGHATAFAEPNYASSFDRAKRSIFNVYADNQVDQYCGCSYDRNKRVDLGSCGYRIRMDGKRAQRIEVEHVVPAHTIGMQRSCWRQGGREFCNQNDPSFSDAHNDLHNLMPVIGEVNANRSNFRFNELPQPYGQYGSCEFKVDFIRRSAEPPQALKGDIARISFYMRDQHGVKLSSQQTQLFSAWSKADPVDQWELERDKRITRVQGNSNPYVTGVAKDPFAEMAVENSLLEARGEAEEGRPFSCQATKTCKAMSSCDEAVYHLHVCGNTRLDGNKDGVPCEAICR